MGATTLTDLIAERSDASLRKRNLNVDRFDSRTIGRLAPEGRDNVDRYEWGIEKIKAGWSIVPRGTNWLQTRINKRDGENFLKVLLNSLFLFNH